MCLHIGSKLLGHSSEADFCFWNVSWISYKSCVIENAHQKGLIHGVTEGKPVQVAL